MLFDASFNREIELSLISTELRKACNVCSANTLRCFSSACEYFQGRFLLIGHGWITREYTRKNFLPVLTRNSHADIARDRSFLHRCFLQRFPIQTKTNLRIARKFSLVFYFHWETDNKMIRCKDFSAKNERPWAIRKLLLKGRNKHNE